MKISRFGVGILTLLLPVLAVSLSGCSSKKSTSGGGGGTTSTPNVAVLDNSFSPKTDSVAVGTTVIWTYNGASVHTVTSDTGTVKELNSGDLNSGNKTYSHQFNSTGDFYYYCKYHGTPGSGGSFGSGMTGVVKVR